MMDLKERVGIQSTHFVLGTPTSYRTEIYRYPLYCGICQDLYYVDERILRQVYSALEADQSEIPFSCGPCEKKLR
jgi:hypothetical protein